MLCIYNDITDPYFNIASEDFLLNHIDDEVFMLWQNDNAIIIGKHQNALAEINLDYVNNNNVKVVRRLTGGGAVFHDMGNLNFTFITNYSTADPELDFKKFTQPIIDILATLGINAYFSGRNDILIDEQKFSGNAEHVNHKRKRILHHGTLLFASEIADLSAALKVNPLKYEDKAVKSVRSRVTNISSHLKEAITVYEFRNLIMNHIVSINHDVKMYHFSENDIESINELKNKKYNSWEWNFGYSPKYALTKAKKTDGGHIELHFSVKNGIIEGLQFLGDFFVSKDIDELESIFKGQKHDYEHIKSMLSSADVSQYFRNISNEDILDLFF